MIKARPFKIAIFGSGKGSNMVAIAEAVRAQSLPISIEIVISDVPDAKILVRARELDIPSRYVNPGSFRTKLDEAAEQKYIQIVQEARVDLVVLAGFMRILKGNFLRLFENRVINIHPSLLPAFPGLESWKQALDYGVKVTGCTVHFVDQGMDTGPIIAQETVPVLEGDSAETLHGRIQEKERMLYPQVLGLLAAGNIRVHGRHTSRCFTNEGHN